MYEFILDATPTECILLVQIVHRQLEEYRFHWKYQLDHLRKVFDSYLSLYPYTIRFRKGFVEHKEIVLSYLFRNETYTRNLRMVYSE